MRKKLNIPRIIKIQKIDGLTIQCMFNNGENRILDFKKIFDLWKVGKDDVEYPLLNFREFKKVELRNFTLSWSSVPVTLISEAGDEEIHPYELSPDELYRLSEPAGPSKSEKYGSLIRTARLKAGLTQEQLAERSGTSRFYISRLENNRTDVELSTFRKIVEAGLGKHFKLIIE
ncbi:MAG: helix-turn-helix domain-containing protein [Flavobacteriaceae bacterium]|nr:helix-turn-helix domain-containing protein [Flavobacteriaceae bacterium]MDH5694958.1 helix-turn-helix domain-containing protein [Gammaproteobacteria bacterium]